MAKRKISSRGRAAGKKKRAKAARKTAKRSATKKSTKKRSASRTAGKKIKARPKSKAKVKAKSKSKSKVKAKSKPRQNAVSKKKAKGSTTTAGKAGSKKTLKVQAPSARQFRTTRPPVAIPEPRKLALPSGLKVVDDSTPLPKTRLSASQLAEFRQKLLDKRRELIGDMDNLAGEALRRNRQDAAGDLSSMPIHMADIGSDNWEQEFTLGLISSERALLKEIDEALQRLEDGTYGVCLATHRPIAVARLRAKPWARYCIDYARLREQGRLP